MSSVACQYRMNHKNAVLLVQSLIVIAAAIAELMN